MPIDSVSFGWHEKGATGLGQTGHFEALFNRRFENQGNHKHIHRPLLDGQQHGRRTECTANGFNRSSEVSACKYTRILLTLYIFQNHFWFADMCWSRNVKVAEIMYTVMISLMPYAWVLRIELQWTVKRDEPIFRLLHRKCLRLSGQHGFWWNEFSHQYQKATWFDPVDQHPQQLSIWFRSLASLALSSGMPINWNLMPSSNIVNRLTESVLNFFLEFFSDKNAIVYNSHCGHMLRTKLEKSNEGGVAAGAGALDSPYLYDDWKVPRKSTTYHSEDGHSFFDNIFHYMTKGYLHKCAKQAIQL